MKNMHIAFSPPDITEEEIAEVVDTLRSGWITTGPKTKLFEKKLAEYMGTNRVVCLNSATACLEMTLRLLGIGPGDEVITTAYTYSASASVVSHVGAKLVLIDVAKDSYEMDYEKLADAINEASDGAYHYVYDRSQERKKRESSEIGISAVRGGTIVGDHDVIFAGTDEVITFEHRAYSRAVFGKGAIQAAKFLAGKPAGRYDMSDVIG